MKKSLSIAATFTVEPINNSLELLLGQLGLPYSISFAPYAQLFQQLLEPSSLLNSNKTGINIALVRVEDLLNKAKINQGYVDSSVVTLLANDFSSALNDYASFSKTPLLVVIMPSNDHGLVENEWKVALSIKFHECITNVTASLSNVFVKSYASINTLYPLENIFDAEAESFGHVPYTDNLFAALACYICRFASSISRPEKKVIVLDCDNTLWQGVCGEDGTEGITVTDGHQYLQRFMLEQLNKGMLLCLNSKNSEQDVINVLRQNKNMHISLDDLVLLRVNWLPKSENLKSLAAELNLSLDSFIFLDDNPVEIAEVNASCPQVMTLTVPQNWQEIPAMLDQAWVFDKFRVTDADKNRAATYQDNIKRQSLQTTSSSFEDFLQKLQLNIKIEPLTATHLARAVQLNQRTNQFNASTKRRDEESFEQVMHEENAVAFTVEVTDRFGEYGIVGLIAAQLLDTKQFLVTDFVLSCRALGKGVEYKMLSHIAQMAIEKKVSQVIVEFIPNARNEPVYQFLELIKHSKIQLHKDNFYQYESVEISNLQYKGTPSSAKLVDLPPKTAKQIVTQDINENTFYADVIKYCQPERVVKTVESQIKTRSSTQQPYVMPKKGLERRLASIWKRVLGIDCVGSQDRFTDLGGKSLQLVKVHGLILNELGTKVTIVELFEHATVSALARYLERGNTGAENEDSKNKGMEKIRLRALKQRATFRNIKK